MSRFDVVALGEPLYELNRQPDGNWLSGFGGDTLNVAIGAARHGCRAAYVTRLGQDIFGEELLALMQREGVDVTAVAQGEGATGLYFITHGPNGHVFTYRRAGSEASRMTPAGLDRTVIAAARMLHVSGISQAISDTAAETVAAAMAMAREAGAGICFDTNFRPRLWPADKARPAIEAAVAQADIVKTSVEDATALFGLAAPPAIARHLLGLGAGAVAVTLGAEGAYVATADRAEQLPAHRVAAVDASGAGDAFTGALLAEVLRGQNLFAAARYAVVAAGLSTLGFGSILPLPRRAAVEAALAAG